MRSTLAATHLPIWAGAQDLGTMRSFIALRPIKAIIARDKPSARAKYLEISIR